MDVTKLAPLEWIRARISRLMIEVIARNDRGEDWELHLAAMQKLFAPIATWEMLAWHPREVLEFTPVRSAIFPRDEAVYLATRFRAWVHERQSAPIPRPFVALGILLLTAHAGRTADLLPRGLL